MKKAILSILLLGLCLTATAQEPLIDSTEMPNAVYFLPAPPDTASAAFQYDKSQYRWGKEQRKDSVRRAIAVRDAVWTMETLCREYSKPFGMTISKESTPAIYQLLVTSVITADQAGKLPKNHYMRTRPYVYYNEPTIVPEDEEDLRHNGSYPSGHTIRGWSTALILTEVNPDRADTIMARGYMFGQSRVIAGFHWQSDVDAGRLVASVAVARMHADPRFMKLMEEAKKEFKKLSKRD